MHALSIATDDGVFVARYSPGGLRELRFPSIEEAEVENASSTMADVWEWHRLTSVAVAAILKGKVPDRLPPLDLNGHTAFRRKVWAEMRQITFGQAISYSELARRIQLPNATRAVGGACGANPIPLIIPCHRVLAAGQRLGGFSGGIEWKRKLLAVEQISYFGV